jgi:hypothetical protein
MFKTCDVVHTDNKYNLLVVESWNYQYELESKSKLM